jgi:4-carboxymuconolactone decarboxylase
MRPLEASELDAEAKEILSRQGRAGGMRIFRTLAHHPKLLKRWLVFGSHVLGKSTLSERDREVVILRIGWLCRSVYEFSAHVPIGLRAGISEADLARIQEGPTAAGLSAHDAVLLRATDELRRDSTLSSATWTELSAIYSREQILDLIFTIGQYQLVSMATNALGIVPEEPYPGFPS